MKRNSAGIAAIAVAVIIFCMPIGTARSQEPPRQTPDLISKGKRIYAQRCASCHGILGNGRGLMAAVLNPAPNNFTEPLQQWKHSQGDPAGIFRIIRQGAPDSAMVGYDFADEDIWALVYTVMGFSDRKSATGSSGNGATK
jgi:mono/diheme cytochrome c family protein